MSIEENKDVAARFLARFTAGDVDGALAMMTDDATWWLPGKKEHMPVTGVRNKEQIARVFRSMIEQLPHGLRMTVKSAIGEGDKLALEVESYGELKNGRVYNQEYHFVITIRGEKVAAVREYLDTQHAFATWFQP
jgi:uncharacterized protein